MADAAPARSGGFGGGFGAGGGDRGGRGGGRGRGRGRGKFRNFNFEKAIKSMMKLKFSYFCGFHGSLSIR